MRNFLKQNLLAILVCLCAVAALSSAATLVRPYTSADYAGGSKAVGSKVNTEFDTIVNWLNGANIGTTNLANSGVTLGKLAASNIKVTASSSAYSMNSLTPATVTNLSTTFTATGRPVTISLENVPEATFLWGGSQRYGGGVAAGGMTAGGSSTNDGHHLFFVRDSSTTAFFNLYGDAGGADTQNYQCSAFSYTETPAAGTYTYAVKASVKTTGGANSVVVNNCRLVVREW